MTAARRPRPSPAQRREPGASAGTAAPPPPALHPSDLRGLAQLATEATLGITDLVEAMHGTILRAPLPLGRFEARGTGGIPGLVYRSIRGVTRLAGSGVDALLGGAVPPPAVPEARSPQGLALRAALNGVFGDHLAASGNPLALPMSLHRAGDHAAITARALVAALHPPAPRLVLLVHGLCMNDRQWRREGHDHGEALARDLPIVPVYLRYNTGQPIAANGRALAALLRDLWQALPAPRPRLAIVGHSMGGLVARSACRHAGLAGDAWLDALDTLVFLGTPHLGAPLERAGTRVDRVLGLSPYLAPFRRLGLQRSAGIRDLAHGRIDDGDEREAQEATGLPAGVRCCAVAASLGKRPRSPTARRVGDGLVPVASALGRHRDPARALPFADARVVHEAGHLDLLSRGEVYLALREWLDDAAPPRRAGRIRAGGHRT